MISGPWLTLRSFLVEAKSASDYRNDLIRFMTKRYGEHEVDQMLKSASSMSAAEWRKHMAMEYMSDEIDGIISNMFQAHQSAANAKKERGRGPEVPKSKDATQGPSGRQYVEPGSAAEKQAKIDQMRQARASVGNAQDAGASLLKPSTTQGQKMGTAGQNQPRPQPTVAAGVVAPEEPAGQRISRSGLVRAQRAVDKETAEKGEKAGEILAKRLGVPTTAERTAVDDESGERRVHVWGPDKVLKHMDPDKSGRGAAPAVPGTDAIATKRAQSHARAKDTEAGRLSPDRIAMIKQGILKRNAADPSGKVGPGYPGKQHGQHWQPHGMSTPVGVSRKDMATGNYIRGHVMKGPEHTGQGTTWDANKGEWVTDQEFNRRYPTFKDQGKSSKDLVHRAQARAGTVPNNGRTNDPIRPGQTAASDFEMDDEDDEYPEADGWTKVG